MPRLFILALLAAGSLFAQMPRNLYPWWSNKVIVQQLNLSRAQVEGIRGAVMQYRARLMKARANVLEAEQNLEEEFNRDPVDQDKTRQAIEQLITARSDLTRSLSELSLKLRVLLTPEQWKQLQRLRPNKQAEEQQK
jgi:Spy/CpxP family protein refolding chaperone